MLLESLAVSLDLILNLTLVRLLVDQLGGELAISGDGGADFRVRSRDGEAEPPRPL